MSSTDIAPEKLPPLQINILNQFASSQAAGHELRLQEPVESSHHLSSFDRFSLLPPELRLRIWETMLPGPRVLEICVPQKTWPIPRDHAYRESESEDEEDEATTWANMESTEGVGKIVGVDPPEFFCSASIPVILHVNLESRMLALQHYTLAFRSPCRQRPANIFINFDIDTLYFPEWVFDNDSVGDISPFENATLDSDRALVKHVAIDILRWFHAEGSRINGQINFSKWIGLKTLTWVSQKAWDDGRCITCEDRGRPEHLGEVGLLAHEDGKRFGVKETESYLKLRTEKLSKYLGEDWAAPKVKSMSLVRDGVEAYWPRASDLSSTER